MKVQFGNIVLCSGTRRESVIGLRFRGERNIQLNTLLRAPHARPVPRQNRRVNLSFSVRIEYDSFDLATDAMQERWEALPDTADLVLQGGAIGGFGRNWFYKDACIAGYDSEATGVSVLYSYTFQARRMDRNPRAI